MTIKIEEVKEALQDAAGFIKEEEEHHDLPVSILNISRLAIAQHEFIERIYPLLQAVAQGKRCDIAASSILPDARAFLDKMKEGR